MNDVTEMPIIKADWDAPDNVTAFTTTRLGGVSNKQYQSFNMGHHVGDETNAVLDNRQLLISRYNLPSEPVWLDQVHGTNIIELSDLNSRRKIEADGVYTRSKGMVCAVMTADCMPLFLCNRAGNVVALLHVGWRGLAAGIIERGVNIMGGEPERLMAWSGPTISGRYFEIGGEVREQLGGSEQAYRPSTNSGKYYADLIVLTGQRLLQAGVRDYKYTDVCTYAEQNLCYSYRRDGQTGRMASIIWFD